MSINPVPVVSSIPEAQAAPADNRAQSHASRVSAQPISERDPKPETIVSENSNSSRELPQDEVEVQRDTQTGGEIVVRYMDSSGNLILQVPTEQVLGMQRDFRQDLEHEQASRSSSTGGQIDPPKERKNGH